MKIALLGATGNVGAHLLREALSRDHSVTGVARHPGPLLDHPRLTRRQADARYPDQLAAALVGHDVIVSSLAFRAVSPDAVITAARRANASRLVVVGGAGSLEVAPGRRLVDSPDFPGEYREEALAGCEFLRQLQQEPELDWSFLSPSALLHEGPRTGKFRLGGDTLIVDETGQSHISIADFAVALLDEVETGRHSRRRFTVGY